MGEAVFKAQLKEWLDKKFPDLEIKWHTKKKR
jgi:hypothetical protein